jgi:hypothetical protein
MLSNNSGRVVIPQKPYLDRRISIHNEWQTYRTRKDKSLQLEITNTYAEAGENLCI